jgi:hypothetical protein
VILIFNHRGHRETRREKIFNKKNNHRGHKGHRDLRLKEKIGLN